jgi:YesN/AraC family two-component response regulator
MKTERTPAKLSEEAFSLDGFFAGTHNVIHESLHWHEFFEFELVISGSGINILNGIPEEIKTGCMIFLTPTDFHEIKTHPDAPLKIINVHFNEMFVSEDIRNELVYCVAQSVFLDEDVFSEINKEFIRLLNEQRHDLLLRKTSIRNSIDRILLILFRNRIEKEVICKNKSSLGFALQYIEQHYREDLTLNKIADLCHFTPCYFSKKFHDEFGRTFQEYLMNKRLNLAKNLLKSTDLSIMRVCFESGFNNHTYFTRMFKRLFNLTPSEMRSKYQNKR